MPVDVLVEQALAFSDDVEARGIARLREAHVSEDERRLWCTWDTDDPEGLQEAFDKMNEQSGLRSELTQGRAFFP